MNTVITKGNEVRQYTDIDSIERSVEGPFLAIDNSSGSKVAFTEISPITWPTDATNDLQAIVDVKAGTLRFGWVPVSGGFEFVVSEYVAPAESVEDCDLSTANQLLDLITEWPENTPHIIPTGNKLFEYGAIFHDNYVEIGTEFECLTTSILKRDWLNYHENKKKYANDHCGDEGIELTYSNPVTATSMLTAALGHMEDRAKTYDAPGGERSMGKTVSAFNIITGLELTEEQGWLFMEILKQVRSQQGNYRSDNYEDMVAYAALRGECAARERGSK